MTRRVTNAERSDPVKPPTRPAAVLILALGASWGAGLAATPAAAQEGTADDARAQELADRVMEALGGQEAWDATRYVVFDFAGRRTHWWDRYTGRHRLEGTTREGESYLVLEDVDDRGEAGRAWFQGKPAEGEQAAELLKNAYAAWINDTYWLLAPYKLRDPGVHLVYAGRETVGDVTYDKLKLTFERVGLTPGDTYWMYVHPETGRVERWAYVLESQEPPPTVWEWRGWQPYGSTKILLAPERVQPDGGRELSLAPMEVPDELPDAVFESPDPVERALPDHT
jgi:hypothetical protein